MGEPTAGTVSSLRRQNRKVKVYWRHNEAMYDKDYITPDTDVLVVGRSRLGYRWEELEFSPYARSEILRAIKTVRWLERLTCAFADLPEDLREMLGLD